MKHDMRNLMNLAVESQKGAYAPYSGRRVGAALLVASGEVFTGANVENSSYGLSMCAERVAAAKAIGDGKRQWVAMAVAVQGHVNAPPCGACLQFLAEFAGEDLILVWGKGSGPFKTARLRDLLPHPFRNGSAESLPEDSP